MHDAHCWGLSLGAQTLAALPVDRGLKPASVVAAVEAAIRTMQRRSHNLSAVAAAANLDAARCGAVIDRH
jgi:hypothetical protein